MTKLKVVVLVLLAINKLKNFRYNFRRRNLFVNKLICSGVITKGY